MYFKTPAKEDRSNDSGCTIFFYLISVHVDDLHWLGTRPADIGFDVGLHLEPLVATKKQTQVLKSKLPKSAFFLITSRRRLPRLQKYKRLYRSL